MFCHLVTTTRRLSAVLALALIATSCFQGKSGHRGSAYRRTASTATVTEDGGTGAPPPRPSGTPGPLQGGLIAGDWTFLGPQVLSSVIRRDLQVNESNTNPEAAQVLTLLNDHAATFGQSNYAMGVRQNLGAEPVKFRFLVEIVTQACYVGMQTPAVRDRFFPSVTSASSWNSNSFEMIFIQLLGRSPSNEEKALLLRTVQATPTDVNPPTLKQTASVCAIVLSSLEFAHAR